MLLANGRYNEFDGVFEAVQTSKISLSTLSLWTRFFYVISQALAHAIVPFLFILLLLRSRKEPAHLQNLSHRFGFGPKNQTGQVWIYAASLGETRAASPLVRRLLAEGYTVLLTHQSPAGYGEGSRLFGNTKGVTQSYVPLDLFWTLRIFLRRFRPIALIVMEIELWPAMLIETVRKDTPVMMANGNLLDESLGRGVGPRYHIHQLYQLFGAIFTRSEAYKERYLHLGIAPARIFVVGDMKFDQTIDPAQVAMGQSLRTIWDGSERVLMIASSVEAEEPLLLPMVARLIAADAGLRVVWAPRSPQRFQAVAKALASLGLTGANRSQLDLDGNAASLEAQVLVGDSIGEMNIYYAISDLVFVGASLVAHGGHNIIEPMALGRPVVMGPSTYGIDFIAKPAGAAGAFKSLMDVAKLEAEIMSLLSDPEALSRMVTATRDFYADKSGAADRSFDGMKEVLQMAKRIKQ